jgi:acetoin utilization deacetylase AcuC-like enzyme
VKTPAVYSPTHRLHAVATGTWVGVQIPSDELVERVEIIIESLRGLGHEIVATGTHDDTILERVHDPELVSYMRDAYDKWIGGGYLSDPGQPQVSGYAFPTARFLDGLPLRLPASPGALAGVYAMDTMTQIGAGTYEGARAAFDMAITAAELVVGGASSAYAACRPPGHHAGRDFFGGSCYLNNAGAAVETLRAGGFERVAVIDLDAHHGNGTQQIFYSRDDVAYGSVHVDPAEGWFPHFVGYADEIGREQGEGANLNIPLKPGTGDEGWLRGVDRLIDFSAEREAGAVVVSLGVDAAITDPNSPLLITESGYAAAGERIGSLSIPTVFVQEGGYVPATIGRLVSATLTAFDSARGDSEK